MPLSAAITYFRYVHYPYFFTLSIKFVLVGFIFFSYTLRCHSLHFSTLFSSSVILSVVSDRPEFCNLCGLGVDRDPYKVVAKQMIDDSAIGNDRVFTYFAYYDTHCVLEMYPRYLIENEAKASSAPILLTVDDYDVQVGSTRPDFPWEDAIGERGKVTRERRRLARSRNRTRSRTRNQTHADQENHSFSDLN